MVWPASPGRQLSCGLFVSRLSLWTLVVEEFGLGASVVGYCMGSSALGAGGSGGYGKMGPPDALHLKSPARVSH